MKPFAKTTRDDVKHPEATKTPGGHGNETRELRQLFKQKREERASTAKFSGSVLRNSSRSHENIINFYAFD